jgi:hypothetical protein
MIYLLGLIGIWLLVYFGYKAVFRAYFFKKRSQKLENAELIKTLLNLEPESLDELFALYRKEFGAGAARYARDTYRKWQAGEVRPNRRTFGRFLVYLPRVMSFDLKCEVLRELREAYCARDNYELTVSTDDWKETLMPLVKDIIARASAAELPVAVKERLKWLADDDMEIARAILTRSETMQTLDALAMLEKEFSNIEQLLDNAGRRGKVTHALRLPLGTISLKIRKRS